jgi:hypothetical protein
MRTYVLVSAIIFTAIMALQVARLVLAWPVTVAGYAVPLWASAVAAVVAGILAVSAVRLLMRMRSTPVAR